MNRPTILIVSDESEFSNAITGCWLAESNVPAFVLASSREDECENFDLAIVGGVHEFPVSMLSCLRATGKPVIYLSPNNDSAPTRADVVPVPEIPGWPKLVIGVAARLLEAAHATEEAARLAEMNSQLEQQATLGRYMLVVRARLSNPPIQAAEPVLKYGYGSSDERSHGRATHTGRDSADCGGVCN